jgi:hypothetical protein
MAIYSISLLDVSIDFYPLINTSAHFKRTKEPCQNRMSSFLLSAFQYRYLYLDIDTYVVENKSCIQFLFLVCIEKIISLSVRTKIFFLKKLCI